ncbi:MAG: hypothetical protein LQ348_002129 [Seirophora lacunosa]|nr:MAG: hypothetical protein LQ348_002129 [Seirophora lacunosa]
MGATELVNLSIIHPRLFSSLILIEPIILNDIPPGPNIAMASTLRQDCWPDRKAAEHALRTNKLFQSFHPQVLRNYMDYGLRDLPTAIYPDSPLNNTAAPSPAVTLTTTKHQEVWTFARSNFSVQGPAHDEQLSAEDRVINPNADPRKEMQLLFYRPECTITFNNLPHVRPATYFVFGGRSPFSPSKARLEKERLTGTGIGGSGGVEVGKVRSYVFKDAGHFIPFVNVEALANVVHTQISEGLRQAQVEDALWERHDSQKSERDRLVVSKKWQEGVRKPAAAKRSIASKL